MIAQVMQVRKKDDGKIYAMKILSKETIIERNQVEHTKAEKDILQKIRNRIPFIVNLNYAFQSEDKVALRHFDPSNMLLKLYMILDFVNGGELFHHLKKEKKFSEERCRFYAAEIVSALSHLHSLGIVYRDLKVARILHASMPTLICCRQKTFSWRILVT
jgi:serum/glucocorticoid-regulated kinase 2